MVDGYKVHDTSSLLEAGRRNELHRLLAVSRKVVLLHGWRYVLLLLCCLICRWLR